MFVDYLVGELVIDKERMYIIGLSMGGFGIWDMLVKYFNLFVVVVLICGGGCLEIVDNFMYILIWVFYGDVDKVVLVDFIWCMVVVFENCDVKIWYMEYEGVGYNFWSEIYVNEEFYFWFLE